jgi:SOS-response transcriptional repressor LexA
MSCVTASPDPSQVLDFIVSFKSTHNGIAPSIREICAATGASSTSIVKSRLEDLHAAGLILFPLGQNVARAIAVPGYTFAEAS